MKRKIIVSMIASLFIIQFINAQVFYVDSKNGNDKNAGTLEEPFKDIEKAVSVANNLTGFGSITIRLKPGIYILKDKVCLNPIRVFNDTCFFTIEAYIMPNDSNWEQNKMPIIQSISFNNTETYFNHSIGFLAAANNIKIRGIKFLGNPNPSVPFYYPIAREDSTLINLEILQCYFTAEKNTAAIQGGIYAQGQGISIQHCIFTQCRNAILLFKNINRCTITNNIIYQSAESALWIGENSKDFEFNNNVISKCNYFWINCLDGKQTHKLTNCVITNNKHYCGDSKGKLGLVEINKTYFREVNIVKEGVVNLIERIHPKIPKKCLHLTSESVGYNLNAGIFK